MKYDARTLKIGSSFVRLRLAVDIRSRERSVIMSDRGVILDIFESETGLTGLRTLSGPAVFCRVRHDDGHEQVHYRSDLLGHRPTTYCVPEHLAETFLTPEAFDEETWELALYEAVDDAREDSWLRSRGFY